MRAVRSSRMVAGLALVMALVLALVGAGCATRGSAGGSAIDSIEVPPGGDQGPAGVSCVDLGYPSRPGVTATATEQPARVPDGFTPVAATRCLAGSRTVPGDGVWMTRIEQRAEGDFTALM